MERTRIRFSTGNTKHFLGNQILTWPLENKRLAPPKTCPHEIRQGRYIFKYAVGDGQRCAFDPFVMAPGGRLVMVPGDHLGGEPR